MQFNPYEVLGVQPDATISEIQSAYRKESLKHHPDRKGDSNQFKAVSEARDILVDPARRMKFDQTGETEHDPTNEVESIIAPMLAEAFAQDSRDPIRMICDRLAARRSDFEDSNDKLSSGIKKLSDKIEKFKLKNNSTSNVDGREFVIANLTNGLNQMHSTIDSNKQQIELMTECLAFLNDLQFQTESTYRTSPFAVPNNRMNQFVTSW